MQIPRSSLELTIAVVALLLGTTLKADVPYFTGVGDFPGGPFESYVNSVSFDGGIAVGISDRESTREAFKYQNGSMQPLGLLPSGGTVSQALGVSGDGSVIVGSGTNINGNFRAFRWQSGVMQEFGNVPSGSPFAVAEKVSANGSVVIGWAFSSGGQQRQQGHRWENGVFTYLGDLPGGVVESHPRGVSSDGGVIVGESSSALGTEAFVWQGGQMVGLGDLPGGAFYSTAFGVSGNGSIVVGGSVSGNGYEAVRWINGVPQILGDLPGGGYFSSANAVSGDGSIVVGLSCATSSCQFAPDSGFIWDQGHGMRNLLNFLKTDLSLNLAGWSFLDPQAISGDGKTIVGYGRNPLGQNEGFIAHIPEPSTLALFLLSGIGLLSRKKRDL